MSIENVDNMVNINFNRNIMKMLNMKLHTDKELDDMVVDGLREREDKVEDEANNEQCSICFDECFSTSEGLYHSKYVTPCSHTFHLGCIAKWFRSSPQKTCPLCRTDCVPMHCVRATAATAADLNFNIDIIFAEYAYYINDHFANGTVLNNELNTF